MPSQQAEGKGLLGNIAMSVGDLAIEKGIPYLAKKGFEAGRYYASEAMRNPRLQKKANNYTINRLIGVIWTVLGLIFTKQLITYLNQNGDGYYLVTILLGPFII